VVLNSLINLSFIAYNSLIDLATLLYLKAKRKRENKETLERLKNRALFGEKFPRSFGAYAKVQEEFEARLFCWDWIPQRQWLKQNRIEFDQFPEEKKYQELKTKFSFQDKAEKIYLIRQ
jgi:hypothetical protein